MKAVGVFRTEGAVAVQVTIAAFLSLFACCFSAEGVCPGDYSLPIVDSSVPVREADASSWPCLEVCPGGSVALNGEVYEDLGADLRAALRRTVGASTGRGVDEDQGGGALVLIASGDTPWSQVERVFKQALFRGIVGKTDILLAVDDPTDSLLAAIRVRRFEGESFGCGSAATIRSEVVWAGPYSSSASLVVSRVESLRDAGEGQLTHRPFPKPLRGGELQSWLALPFPIAKEIMFVDRGDATWQDVVSLLDTCHANRIPWIGDFNIRLHSKQ